MPMSSTSTIRRRPPRSWAVGCLMVLALSILALESPSSAAAQVLDSDRVDGRSWRELGIPRAGMPDVTMAAGALVTSDGRVLWQRRGADRRAIASITKIMTAVVAMENSQPDDVLTVPNASIRVGESTSFLRAGERLPVSEVLEALLVKSGNDAAVALARHVSGSEDDFVQMMNDKAEELGLTRTSFSNPHGLDEPGNYSTATDVAVMARYAMTKPLFRRIVAQKTAMIGTGARAERIMSTNLLIGNYMGANGVKTGWTDDAGYCVVASAQRDGVELFAVVLGTTTELRRFRDARELLDFGFAHYRPQRIASAGTVIGEAPVADYLDVTAPAAVSQDVTVTVFDLAGVIEREVIVPPIAAPVKVGDRLGVASFVQGDEVIATIPLVAVVAVEKPGLVERIWIAIVRAWRAATGADDVGRDRAVSSNASGRSVGLRAPSRRDMTGAFTGRKRLAWEMT